MARRNSQYAVTVRGYSAFRRSLRRLDKDLDTQLRDYVKEIAGEVAEEARKRTPVRSGALQNSIRASVTQKRATIYSTKPYAGVVEWGGTIRPKGAPIKFDAARMMVGAVESKSEEVEARMLRIFDSLTSTSGF